MKKFPLTIFIIILLFISNISYAQMAEGPGIPLLANSEDLSVYNFFGKTKRLQINTVELGKTNLQYNFVGAGIIYKLKPVTFKLNPVIGYDRAYLKQVDGITQSMKQFTDRIYLGLAKFPKKNKFDSGYSISFGWSRVDLWDGLRDRYQDGGIYFANRIFLQIPLITRTESPARLNSITSSFLSSKLNGTDTAYAIGFSQTFSYTINENFGIQFGAQFNTLNFDFKFHGVSKKPFLNHTSVSYLFTETSFHFGLLYTF